MTIRHHLSDQLLMAYSAGALPEAFSLVVATHVSMCDACRARLLAFDAVGGAVIEETEAVALGEGSLVQALARLDGLPQANARVPVRGKGILPAPLLDYVGDGLESVRWRSVGMGVRQVILRTDKAASARLLYIPAGHAVPDHGHRGVELTLVLQGAFCDANDRFERGDVEIADEAVEHTPVAAAGEPCICLAATDAPLRFNGLVPRIAQTLFRI